MKYTVRLSVAAQRDIDALVDYLVVHAGEPVAQAYIDRLQTFLKGFQSFPKQK